MLSAIKKIEAHFEGRLLAEIDPYTLHMKMERGDTDFVVLDVRSEQEFMVGHVPGARSFPLEILEDKIKELPHGKVLVIYCYHHAWLLAAKAALKLAKRGYHTKELLGGYDVWKSKYAFEKGLKQKQRTGKGH